jgi:hypothetical protein
MDNYQEMYAVLFHKISDIIEQLQDVQKQTEEFYMQSKENKLYLCKFGEKSIHIKK